MGTTMPPPRSRKARQEVRAAELRVRPDAGKCGKGHAKQTADSVGPVSTLNRSLTLINISVPCCGVVGGAWVPCEELWTPDLPHCPVRVVVGGCVLPYEGLLG